MPVFHRIVASAVVAVTMIAVGTGAAAEEGERHTVRPGDTLGSIAARNHTSVRALAEANGVADADRIVVGQVLVIPSAAGAGGSGAATVVHVVAPGETLSAIARRYGSTVAALASANGISDPDLVRIGARLQVPSASSSGSGTSGSSAGGTARSHTVASGETLAGIARRYGTTVGAIVTANRVSNPNLIRAGQVLTVPAGASSPASTPAPTGSGAYGATGGTTGRTSATGTHTVGAGETLTRIAARYGVPVAELATANGILRPWSLYAGARLQLTAPNRIPGDLARCPVPGSRFANDWGFPRSGGRAHAGTDLFAPRGTPVLAPAAGVVSFGTGSIGGRQFRLAGDDGSTYIGSHLDAFGASGRVSAGTVIGYVGNSGNAAGGATHLHFEVRPDDGASMNPYPLLAAAC
jgi:LysM repeat protein